MQNIDILIKPSFYFKLYAVLLISGSIFAVLYSSLFLWIKIFLLVLVGLYGHVLWLSSSLKSPESITRLRLQSGRCLLNDQSDYFLADILGDTTITSFVTVLRFKKMGSTRKQSCLIFCDAVSKEEYRRLRVGLRYCLYDGISA